MPKQTKTKEARGGRRRGLFDVMVAWSNEATAKSTPTTTKPATDADTNYINERRDKPVCSGWVAVVVVSVVPHTRLWGGGQGDRRPLWD